MNQEELNQAIGAIGEMLGIDGLCLDSDNCCALQVNQDFGVEIFFHDGTDKLVFLSEIGQVPKGSSNRVCRKMLEANLLWQKTGGATLALNGETNEAFLNLQVSIRELDRVALLKLLEGFSDYVEYWREELEADAATKTPEESGR